MRSPNLNQPDREGFALVTSLLIILVLSLIAVAAVVLSSTEKRTTFAEGVHTSAVFSADAGSEKAVHFLRLSSTPPKVMDIVEGTVQQESDAAVSGNQEYDLNTAYVGRNFRPGWGTEFIDYDYRIAASGRASARGRSDVALVASRLYRMGY